MKKITYLIFILVITSACKKDDQPQTNPCPTSNTTSYITSQDLLNCKYITGTYWIYIDSVNLQCDSTFIENFDSGLVSETTCNNTYETHSFETVSSPSMITKNYSVVAGGLFKDVSGVNSGTQIYSDYSTAQSMTDYAIDKLDSTYVFDQYYYDVLMVTIDNDASEGNNKSVYYINSDFGFLRHEIYQNSTLISNRILKNKNIVR